MKKTILLTATAVVTVCNLLAFQTTHERNGRRQLYTNATAAGCRAAQCFTVAIIGGNGCTAGIQYYTKDNGSTCANAYNGVRTSTP